MWRGLLLAGQSPNIADRKHVMMRRPMRFIELSAAVEGMSTTAYLVSLGIIGAGAIWVNVGTTLCIGIGVPTIVVGLIGLLVELRD